MSHGVEPRAGELIPLGSHTAKGSPWLELGVRAPARCFGRCGSSTTAGLSSARLDRCAPSANGARSTLGGGDPLPWVSYPAIHLLNERLRPDHTVFEFGAGYSTLYFAARCAAVTTVEHDREWFDEVARVAPENVLLLHRNAGPEYWGAAAQGDVRYDLILVDGLERARCLVGAAQALSETGVVLLDDSHREAYRSAVEDYVEGGFRTLRLVGAKPNHLTESECLLMYRDGNCLGL